MDKKQNHSSAARKPDWFKQELPKSKNFARTKTILSKNGMHTVCEEAKCPNIGTCFSENTATFLIMGPLCSRNCGFCAVAPGAKGQPPDPEEPKKVAIAAQEMGLEYIVVTSVSRDDLPDSGAGHFAETIAQIKQVNPEALVEVLIPDFLGNKKDLQTVLNSGPDVLNHNLETVQRLYAQVRPQANYQISLEVLRYTKEYYGNIPTKSGMILGMGESHSEIEQTLLDLLNSGCKILTLGQYLRPSRKHWAEQRYLTPEEFSEWKEIALDMGFYAVSSGPKVRSSYRAKELYQQTYKTREKL